MNVVRKKEPKDERALPSSLAQTILDSSLISATNNSLYNVKVVRLGKYLQVYFSKNKKRKPVNNDENDLSLVKKENYKSNFSNKALKIDKKNIMRSKLSCQRLAKANSEIWQTFITLTFEEHITDISIANKKYKSFKEQLQRAFSDFKCICVPEFMKNGRVHYHLLTNIPPNSDIIPKRKPLKLWDKKIKQYKILDYYDIKYWNYGFSSAEIVKGDIKKIVGYISKYMTKDIDDRLFGHHRYFYTHNLTKPIIEYLDLDVIRELKYFNNLINKKEKIYENEYINPYDKENIIFNEFYECE